MAQTNSTPDAWSGWIDDLHLLGRKLVVATAGGGAAAISRLLAVPGASRTVLAAHVPYSATAAAEYLGARPEKFCSAPAARGLAAAACEEAIRLTAAEGFPTRRALGVGATASLASDRAKRGAHRVFVAVQSPQGCWESTLVLEKGARSRAAEEELAADLILETLGAAVDLRGAPWLKLLASETVERSCALSRPGWAELLLGESPWAAGKAEQPPPEEFSAVLPGSFNPLHAGHRRMAEIAAERTGGRVAFELSIANVDKPPLDFASIAERVDRFSDDEAVWLTCSPRFTQKAELFPGKTFAVGADTIARIGDSRYYDDSPEVAEAAYARLAELGCRFLVFGRQAGDRFQTLSDVDLPPSLASLCNEVPETEFREDVASTAIRAEGVKSSPGEGA